MENARTVELGGESFPARRTPKRALRQMDTELVELILLLHYGIRGLQHNAPFEGANWKIEDVISEVRANLGRDSGFFDRVFLYLAYNEGQLFTLHP